MGVKTARCKSGHLVLKVEWKVTQRRMRRARTNEQVEFCAFYVQIRQRGLA